ncbi:(2Fe-2S)-binding protein, partial [Bordetella holmesii]|nr:(2Fe-2S)-binding protein [Bordetella holmesii]
SYHRMVFDVDGTSLRVPFPEGQEQQRERYRCSIRHGAYKAFERNGLDFAYMGPPDEDQPFPEWQADFTVAEPDEQVP